MRTVKKHRRLLLILACLFQLSWTNAAIAQYELPPPLGFEAPPINSIGSPALPMDPSRIPLPPLAIVPNLPPDAVVANGAAPEIGGVPVVIEGGVMTGESAVERPAWYNPFGWIGPHWSGSFEIGINGAAGNSDALSFRTGFELSRETTRTNWEIDLTYAKNSADGVETQNNALFYSNWDFKLANPRWSWFSKIGLEYDEFKDFDVRIFQNMGLGYQLIDTDSTQLRPRFGAGSSREFGGVQDQWIPEAVFGFDFAQQISDRQKFSAVVDFYPAWDNFEDYRMIVDLGWELVLDQASNLSLKIGVLDRYDSTPNGVQPNDINYSLLLLWAL